jgi:LPXTG-motif cell wall-anchored protein
MTSLGEKGFLLYDSCIGSCQTDKDKYLTANDYLCANFNPADLIYYYGINPCQGDVENVWQNQTPAITAAKEQAGTSNTIYIIAGAAILALAARLLLRK